VPLGKTHFAREPLDLVSHKLQELRMILFLKLCFLPAERHQLFPLPIERCDERHAIKLS
jgi:hypothetical protein